MTCTSHALSGLGVRVPRTCADALMHIAHYVFLWNIVCDWRAGIWSESVYPYSHILKILKPQHYLGKCFLDKKGQKNLFYFFKHSAVFALFLCFFCIDCFNAIHCVFSIFFYRFRFLGLFDFLWIRTTPTDPINVFCVLTVVCTKWNVLGSNDSVCVWCSSSAGQNFQTR